MYTPEHFAETRDAEIDRLIAAFPLAALVAATPDGLVANHIPILRDGPYRLIGHIALANDLHRAVSDGGTVLAIFRGGDSYVSPNWYPGKAEHHRHVPTWNYQAVHVHGAIRFSTDERAKRAAVGKLTRHLEARVSGDNAWRMADAPRDFMDAMLDAIIAFDIAITRIEAKSKLSQNRDDRDFTGALHGVAETGAEGLAAAMAALRKPGG